MIAAWTMSEWLTIGALALLGALLLFLVGILAVGLFNARSLYRRELGAYFTSPIAYMVLFFFLFATGLLFLHTLGQLTTSGPEGVEYPMREMYGSAMILSTAPSWIMFGRVLFWAAFPLLPALLTMRLFAEEQSSGTMEMLMTAPIREWQVVVSKFLACFTFYLILWIPTLLYLPVLMDLQVSWNPLIRDQGIGAPVWTTLPTLMIVGGMILTLLGLILLKPQLGNIGRIVSLLILTSGILLMIYGFRNQPSDRANRLLEVSAGIDPAPVWTTYLGMILVGAMFLAIGLLASSLVKHQLSAALNGFAACFLFILGIVIRPFLETGGMADRIFYYFDVPSHFQQNFTRGMLDTRNLILYASVTLICLFLTTRSLERRRWV